MAGRWVTVARVLKPHGVHGGMKLDVLSDVPERFEEGAQLFLKGEKRVVTSLKHLNRAVVITLEGIGTPEEVEQYRNEDLQIPEEDLAVLPPDRYYTHDLIGLDACTMSGEKFGSVSHVIENPGSDLLEVRLPTGKQVLFPMRKHAIDKIDIKAGRMFIHTELFDENVQ